MLNNIFTIFLILIDLNHFYLFGAAGFEPARRRKKCKPGKPPILIFLQKKIKKNYIRRDFDCTAARIIG